MAPDGRWHRRYRLSSAGGVDRKAAPVLPRGMRARSSWPSLAACLLLLALAPPAPAAEVTLRVKVPAGKLKSVRLRNLPQGARVAVAVQSDGEIAVVFVGARELKESPGHARPLFGGRVEHRLSFSVTIPSEGNYYVVLDNRKGADPRAVTVAVQAVRVPPKSLPNDKSRSF